ncbi:hypothetical protein [Telluribacter humicola]|uniref:hypothetical protein n=1 Tax=Telluribacter humicola TaxID=1720261 RepID=UPI001A978168|nr:hypothetical protein [Telluribacter humicola]
MRYLTTKGRIISGDSPLEVLVALKNTSFIDVKFGLTDYLELLRLRVDMNYDIKLEDLGHVQAPEDLENIGFLLRLE